jgi:hypothetical protein
MTPEDRSHDAIIRRTLHETAESVNPAGDGLERIRHRLAAPRPARSLLPSLVTSFRLAAVKHLVRVSAATWLRPALAIGGAVAIVAGGVFALGQVEQPVTPAGSVSTPTGTHRTAHAGSSTLATPGAWTLPIGVEPGPTPSGPREKNKATGVLPVATSSTSPPAGSPAARARTLNTPSQAPSTPSPAPSTASSTPSPTDTGTPTPSDTGTPSPSDTGTSGGTPSPGDTGSSGGTPSPGDTGPSPPLPVPIDGG